MDDRPHTTARRAERQREVRQYQVGLIAATQLWRTGNLDDSTYSVQAAEFADLIETLSVNGASAVPGRIFLWSESGSSILANPGTKPESTLGERLLVQATVNVFYGAPGLGKTWLLLQLAHAVANGIPWLGLPTIPARVGYVSFELARWDVSERLSKICTSHHEAADVHVVCRPNMRGAIDLLEQLSVQDLIDWSQRLELGLVIIDPLSRAHHANENAAQEMGAVLAAAEMLAAEGPCVLINHHEGHPNAEKSATRPRGSSRLLSDPNSVLNLSMVHGRRCLTATKVNLGRTPDPIYLAQSADGLFTVAEPPVDSAAAAAKFRATLADVITTNPGLNPSELLELVDVNPDTGKPYGADTIRRHLIALEANGQAIKRKDNTLRKNSPFLWFPAI